MSDVFRLCVETTDGASTNIDKVPATAVMETMNRYVNRLGDGLSFIAAAGPVSWTWDEIHAIRLVRGSYTVEEYP
ncbi:hypothetical protein AMIS_20640 [Actinoplanes missouriensis 431]|uniref:Uncharacterized protein n=1 Tax=Actinoplanes missouriensis (strain ATCC 14538 / DSM 43046 / CBS 188.64 / JCM 3121 / NBRC 102363 / NCIMB 12654 / NRRL B-3342 / UNCC 431) TaxID=512565 RepID=I0H2P7_ACTM4|nr:hypothetical protein [Actinoplanes missouriensis]BAL87284.1 hypothetical protein AMIS_20640 [Actinoplanes missouriensis 431]